MMVKVTSKWDEITKFASMWNMEGLVIIGFCEQDYQKLREAMHIPFVVYDGYFKETSKICNLVIDHYDGGRQVGEYLKNMGHEKVLCIADNYTSMDCERIEGCAAAMGKESVGYLQIPMQREERLLFYREKENEILGYTAVFAVSDFYAAELIHYLQGRRIKVPEDISVIGFDDSPLCHYCIPALTTVRQDADMRAKNAVSILRNLKEGIEERVKVKLPVTLMVRDSVKVLDVIDNGKCIETTSDVKVENRG